MLQFTSPLLSAPTCSQHSKMLLPGDIIISCFLVRILRNVKSFPGSRSRRVLRACSHSRVTRVAYCIVVTLSNDVLIGAPGRSNLKSMLFAAPHNAQQRVNKANNAMQQDGIVDRMNLLCPVFLPCTPCLIRRIFLCILRQVLMLA